MESFMKRVLSGKFDDGSHKYFLRFGKGRYDRRFLISYNIGKKIKIKGSFELANDFVKFIRENKDVKFSGKVLSKDKIAGREGKKKGGVFAYEIENESVDGFPNAYFYLLNVEDSDFVLKVKKALPKPGKDAEKIDDGFCVMEVPLGLLSKVKESFFWDSPECKKCMIEHSLVFDDIILPKDEKDPVKMRERAIRKGKIIRKMDCDGNESQKEYPVEA